MGVRRERKGETGVWLTQFCQWSDIKAKNLTSLLQSLLFPTDKDLSTGQFSVVLRSTGLHLASLHLVFVPVVETSQRKRSTYLPAIIIVQINTFGHSSSSLSFWSLGNSLKGEEKMMIISFYPFFIFIHVFILYYMQYSRDARKHSY